MGKISKLKLLIKDIESSIMIERDRCANSENRVAGLRIALELAKIHDVRSNGNNKQLPKEVKL